MPVSQIEHMDDTQLTQHRLQALQTSASYKRERDSIGSAIHIQATNTCYASRGQTMSARTRSRDYQDYHRPLASYAEKERNRILASKAQRRARAHLHRKLSGAIPSVFNVMQDTPY
jgi:hypothetical protein